MQSEKERKVNGNQPHHNGKKKEKETRMKEKISLAFIFADIKV